MRRVSHLWLGLLLLSLLSRAQSTTAIFSLDHMNVDLDSERLCSIPAPPYGQVQLSTAYRRIGSIIQQGVTITVTTSKTAVCRGGLQPGFNFQFYAYDS